MQEHDNGKMREALKLAFPAVDQELQRDLWPLMLRRMDDAKAQADPVVPWYDWVLAGAVTVAFVFFPKLALLLAYHL
jgi:hypothetical protein